MKPVADLAFCDGFNRFFMHISTSVRDEDGKPGHDAFCGTHFNRNITWWNQSPAMLSYFARCSWLLQQGLFVGDVIFYNGDNCPNLVEPRHSNPSLGYGFDYDVCNTEVLLTRMRVKDGRIVLAGGMSYRLLVLPESPTMPVAVLKKIKELVEAGATIVGPKPDRAPGLTHYPRCDEDIRTLASELWGNMDGINVRERAVGRGRIIWGRNPRDVLTEAGVTPDFEFAGARDTDIDYIHRTTDDAEIYFVANRKNREEKFTATFRVAGRLPELWDAVTGVMRPATAFTQANGRTSLPLELASNGSVFVVFRASITGDANGAGESNFPAFSKLEELTGAWTVNFDPDWGGPAEIQFDELKDWTLSNLDGIKYYSGTAVYRKTFDLPQSVVNNPLSAIWLDLGEVKNVAEVRLNGKSLGVIWTAPWRVNITTTVKPTGNQLEIEITNLWRNRLCGDAYLPQEKRIARTSITFRPNTPLLPSGLMGPVVLQVEQK